MIFFENVPMKELYDNMAKNISALDNYEGEEDKAEFIEFLKSVVIIMKTLI